MRILTGALVALAMAAPGAALAGGIANGQGWTGFYVGGHVGGLRPEWGGVVDSADVPGRVNFPADAEEWAFSGGGQIGYDYQAPGMGGIVLGVVLDGSWIAGDGDSVDNDSVLTLGIDWLVSARIRAGYPVADIMPYFTVGVAHAEFTADYDFNLAADPAFDFSADDNDTGYVAGIGMDWAVTPNVTVGAEALWYDFDYSKSLAGLPQDADPDDVLELNRMLHFRLTANYRF
jgi:outer membrane immunogenic protein